MADPVAMAARQAKERADTHQRQQKSKSDMNALCSRREVSKNSSPAARDSAVSPRAAL
jgi:hypothetical protein